MNQARKTRTTRTSIASDRTTAYALAVAAGDIVSGPHVRNACRRRLQDFEKGRERGLYFDQKRRNGVLARSVRFDLDAIYSALEFDDVLAAGVV